MKIHRRQLLFRLFCLLVTVALWLHLSTLLRGTDLNDPGFVAALLKVQAGGGETCDTVSESLLAVEGTISASLKYFAVAVTNKPGDICGIDLLITLHASETNIFHVDWCESNSTNRPGAVVATSQTVTAATIGSTTTNWISFNFTTPFTPSSGATTTNWIRWAKTVDPVSTLPMFAARANSSVEICVRSSNGDDWENVDLTRQLNYKIRRAP